MQLTQKRMTDSEKSQIINLYTSNKSIKIISDITKFSNTSIIRFLKKQGFEIKSKGLNKLRTKLTTEQEMQLCNDYKNLVSKDKLEIKYNIGWRKLDKILEKHNISSNPQGSYPNPMQGTHFYKMWIEKYGQEKAGEMFKPYLEKWSEESSGKNNPMYGKPSPNGSGQGWKGYYKDFYFRSLRELCYLLYLDENGIPWETAERKKFTIKYKNYDGTDRTYRPDFLVNRNTLVEIKPKRLQKSPLIILKTTAAIEFCKGNGLKFEIIDFPIDAIKIKNALDKKLVKFARDYEERFLNYITKNSNS